MHKFLSALAFVITSLTASAQVTISPVVGSEVSGYGPDQYRSLPHQLRPGICGGVLVDIPVKRKWSLQTGLLYRRDVYRSLISDSNGNYHAEDFMDDRVTVLELPVNVTYSFAMCKKHQFFVGAGPYMDMYLTGSTHIHGHYYDPMGNPAFVDVVYKGLNDLPLSNRMSFGVGLNAGFRSASGWLVCLRGKTGLNLEGAQEQIIDHYNLGIVAGYSFKLKKHKAHAEPLVNPR